jgi:pimeloyl-ACP methyl ester carboxylesterase
LFARHARCRGVPFDPTDHIANLTICRPEVIAATRTVCRATRLGSDRNAIKPRDEHDWEQGLADTAAVIAWLKERGAPVFILGYCFGGSVAWRMAQLSPDLDAASAIGFFIATAFIGDPALRICHFSRYDVWSISPR